MGRIRISYVWVFAALFAVAFVVYRYVTVSVDPVCRGCNVMVISLDQVRAKSLPCFGYAENTAPNLCGFAGKSSVFLNAYTTASRTMPAHFSMMTSLYPSAHGMNLPYADELSKDIPTLTELLKKEGYGTYFLGPTADPHLPIHGGLGRDFDRVFEADDPDLWMRTMDAIATISGKSARPSFFFMHTYDAHEPYIPDDQELNLFYRGPERTRLTYEELCRFTYEKLQTLRGNQVEIFLKEGQTYCLLLEEYQTQHVGNAKDFDDSYTVFNDAYWRQFDDLPVSQRAAYAHALYIAQIHALDKKLGTFFDYLEKKGFMKNTVVVIVGDQGDEFWEHGSYSHGWSLYTEVLRVPFIVYRPGQPATKSDTLVSVVDIVPTLFGVLGKSPNILTAGLDVFSRTAHDMVVAEHVSDGGVGLRTDRYTLIRRITDGSFQTELFDARKDPDEKENIFSGNEKIAESLFDRYTRLRSGFPDRAGGSPDALPTWLKGKDRENLIQSGYF